MLQQVKEQDVPCSCRSALYAGFNTKHHTCNKLTQRWCYYHDHYLAGLLPADKLHLSQALRQAMPVRYLIAASKQERSPYHYYMIAQGSLVVQAGTSKVQ